MEAQMPPAQLKQWFDSAEFEQKYHTDAPLGVWMDGKTTRFALWAPTASEVTLNLYPDGGKSAALRRVVMKKGERGLWLHDEGTRLDGTYYDYDVTVDGSTQRTQDPYAKACGVNGLRAMVVNLADTDPLGWAQDKAPAKPAARKPAPAKKAAPKRGKR